MNASELVKRAEAALKAAQALEAKQSGKTAELTPSDVHEALKAKRFGDLGKTHCAYCAAGCCKVPQGTKSTKTVHGSEIQHHHGLPWDQFLKKTVPQRPQQQQPPKQQQQSSQVTSDPQTEILEQLKAMASAQEAMMKALTALTAGKSSAPRTRR